MQHAKLERIMVVEKITISSIEVSNTSVAPYNKIEIVDMPTGPIMNGWLILNIRAKKNKNKIITPNIPNIDAY